jgi:8-oxo-dGTP pyrophosphatase MutT (NUDIX family)
VQSHIWTIARAWVWLLNERGGDVFLGHRNDIKEENWQMPQGEIKSGESPRQAALRELQEEIGTQNVEILAESDDWLFYNVPKELAERAWGTRFRGQRQKWFVMLFKGHDAEISVAMDLRQQGNEGGRNRDHAREGMAMAVESRGIFEVVSKKRPPGL